MLPGSRRPELPGCLELEGVTQHCILSSCRPASACLVHDDRMRPALFHTVQACRQAARDSEP